MPRDIRYQAAIVRDGHVLLLRYAMPAQGLEFWLLPGGGRDDPAEGEEACVVREAWEETGLEVRVERVVLDVPAEPADGTYQRWRTYLCTPTGGDAQPGVEFGAGDAPPEGRILAVRWLDLRDESTWDDDLRADAYTYPQLAELRRRLGFT